MKAESGKSAAGFEPRLKERHGAGKAAIAVFIACTVFAVLSLGTLLASILNQTAGYVLMEFENKEADIIPTGPDGKPGTVDALDAAGLLRLLSGNLSARRFKALESEGPLAGRKRSELEALVVAELLKPEIIRTWNLDRSIFSRASIFTWARENSPDGVLVFRSWLSPKFLSRSQSADALYAGIRGAILGSLLTIALTMLFAFPLGLGAAIYLEEYAKDNWLNRVIRTNIYNLSGVPSIIYGMLGLGIFVRFLEPLTSGALFGLGAEGSANGRTILSASLTLALLVLPIIIINAQEAIRAVPRSLRESGYALGATKWQVIFYHVLPASMDRILTGSVLALSRGLGETAPLVLVGASTFLTRDPTSIFSKFTTLPIQIYQWTARPQAEFRNIAAAAIVVLLVLLISLNASAILLRDRMRRAKRLG
jgi:phosphate transport system permease protein